MHSRLTYLALVLLVLAAFPLRPSAHLIKGGTFDTFGRPSELDDHYRRHPRGLGRESTVRGEPSPDRPPCAAALASCRSASPSRRARYDFGARVLVTHSTRRPLARARSFRSISCPPFIAELCRLPPRWTSCTITAANGRFTALSAGRSVTRQVRRLGHLAANSVGAGRADNPSLGLDKRPARGCESPVGAVMCNWSPRWQAAQFRNEGWA